MTYTIEAVRTVKGLRHYIRITPPSKRIQGGFASRAAAVERIKLLEMMDQARTQLRTQVRNLRQERTQ